MSVSRRVETESFSYLREHEEKTPAAAVPEEVSQSRYEHARNRWDRIVQTILERGSSPDLEEERAVAEKEFYEAKGAMRATQIKNLPIKAAQDDFEASSKQLRHAKNRRTSTNLLERQHQQDMKRRDALEKMQKARQRETTLRLDLPQKVAINLCIEGPSREVHWTLLDRWMKRMKKEHKAIEERCRKLGKAEVIMQWVVNGLTLVSPFVYAFGFLSGFVVIAVAITALTLVLTLYVTPKRQTLEKERIQLYRKTRYDYFSYLETHGLPDRYQKGIASLNRAKIPLSELLENQKENLSPHLDIAVAVQKKPFPKPFEADRSTRRTLEVFGLD